jgi:hypothetical protein
MRTRDPRPTHMRLMLGLAAVLFVLVVGSMVVIWLFA